MFFDGWGLLEQLPTTRYYTDILYWLYEDDFDGYLIVRNVFTGELRYVEDETYVSYF